MTTKSKCNDMQHTDMLGWLELVFFGMFNGCGNWVDWLNTRNPITLSSSSKYLNNLIDPIVNIGKDVGYLAWHTVTSGTLSAFVVGTFPVTVPALAYFSKEKPS